MKSAIICGCALFLPLLWAEETPKDIPAQEGWKMVWNDEFEKPGEPDPKKWTYEEGLVRNNESQHYVNNSRNNARVEDGVLIIEARKEKVKNPDYDASAKKSDWKKSREFSDYSSASLTTEGRMAMKYGKIEVRAKLPSGKGSWPAIWMLGTNRPQVGWPKCGEIDIMEYVTSEPNTSHATLHWWPEASKHKSKGTKTKNTTLVSDFHVYGMEWDEKMIKFTLDGKPYGSINLKDADLSDGSNAFRKPFYLLLNFALGGSWGGPVSGDDFPRQYLIDYVRVYEKAEK